MSSLNTGTVLLILTMSCWLISVLSVDTNPCDPNPCKNRGTCRQRPGDWGYHWGYECLCEPAYSGAQCQWDNPKCLDDTTTPCQNNATCVTEQDGRFCECLYTNNRTIRFGGHYCETVDPCEACPDGTMFCQTAPSRPSACICLDSDHKELPIPA